MQMVNSDLQPLVSTVASGLGGEVTSGELTGAAAVAVPSAVDSKTGVETEQGGATKVGRWLTPREQASQHLKVGSARKQVGDGKGNLLAERLTAAIRSIHALLLRTVPFRWRTKGNSCEEAGQETDDLHCR